MPATTTTYASAAQTEREAAQATLTCWCGQPATGTNPCTDASPATCACDEHLTDGYLPLTDEERRRQRHHVRRQRTVDVALAVLTTGKAWRTGWSDDGTSESGPHGGMDVTYRLGQLQLVSASGGTAYLLRDAPARDMYAGPLVWAHVQDPDIAAILHAAKRDERIPVQAGFHDGEQVVGGGNVLPRTGR